MPGQGELQHRGREYIAFTEFEGMDTQSDRVGLDPKKLAWCENLQPIAKNQLTLVPGAYNTILNAPFPIVAMYFASISGVSFLTGANGNQAAVISTSDVMILASDAGALFQVDLVTNVLTEIAPPGTFTDPDITQWKSERILIADAGAGYCTWDGFSLTKAGGVSPTITITNGGGPYNAGPPAVTIAQVGAAGAVALPVMSNGTTGIVTSILVVNTNSVGYFGTPTVSFSPNIGGTAATSSAWPTVSFSPNTLAIFAGRVWFGAGRILAWTGTAGYDDFDTANAAGQTALTDSDLLHEIVAIRSLNNYLYIFGDNSIKQIGSVSVVTSTTQFTLVTLSSDQGTLYKQTIRSYNRLIIFANQVGVFAIFGASVEKVSDPMDGLFAIANFEALEMQAMVTDMNSIHCYLLMMQITDPFSGLKRVVLLALMGKKWFLINAGNTIQAIASIFANGHYTAYAAILGSLTPILANSAAPMSFLLKTGLVANRKPMQSKRMERVMVGQNLQGSATITVQTESENGVGKTISYTGNAQLVWQNNFLQVVTWQNNALTPVIWLSHSYLVQPGQAAASGVYLGLTVTGTTTKYKMLNMICEYEDTALMRSTNTGA